jgi:hypothetical protein
VPNGTCSNLLNLLVIHLQVFSRVCKIFQPAAILQVHGKSPDGPKWMVKWEPNRDHFPSGDGGYQQAAEKLESAVILRSSGDEESRIALKMLRARSFAMLRMTAFERFSAA